MSWVSTKEVFDQIAKGAAVTNVYQDESGKQYKTISAKGVMTKQAIELLTSYYKNEGWAYVSVQNGQDYCAASPECWRIYLGHCPMPDELVQVM
jgi:hypothetical protein